MPGVNDSSEAQKQAVRQLLETLKNNPGPEAQQQLLDLLKGSLNLSKKLLIFIKGYFFKASPHLMEAFIRQRQENVRLEFNFIIVDIRSFYLLQAMNNSAE
jgi:hypothetical protein